MIEVGKWWLDLGIDGFRLDVVLYFVCEDFVDFIFVKDIVFDWFKFFNLFDNYKYLN